MDLKAELNENSHTAYEAIALLWEHDKRVTNTKERYVRRLHNNRNDVADFCQRLGITDEQLSRLSVIHVTGTKGKGSTCAMTERILVQHGFSTAMLTSPSLCDYRERYRINCKPVSQDLFSKHFWRVYNGIVRTQRSPTELLPFPTQLYTLIAFSIFVEAQVDVVILEVGIGGELDGTNIIKNTVACGVTSLGIDHVELLGDTVSSIAWHKAGIFKPGAVAFTAPQPEEALIVLQQRAREKQCPLRLVPAYEEYQWGGSEPVTPGIAGSMQPWNASLAIQLTNAWLQRHKLTLQERIRLNAECLQQEGADLVMGDRLIVHYHTRIGLKHATWPGRHQIIRRDDVIYYLDGAHTVDSMKDCAEWYREQSQKDAATVSGSVKRVMIYNLFDTRRPVEKLLTPFAELEDFDAVIFCPNWTNQKEFDAMGPTADKGVEKCRYNRSIWQRLKNRQNSDPTTKIVSTMAEALETCHQYKQDVDQLQVVIVGGLGIVGSALKILDPNMNDRDVNIKYNY